MLAKLDFCLAAPTPAFLLSHMVEVGEETDWAEDLATHLMELTMQDYQLACLPPSKIASSIFSIIKNADEISLLKMEACCPLCEPANTDLVCHQFLQNSLDMVADLLSC